MSLAQSLYSFLALVIRFLPNILDSGIQIWNAVEIDQMVKSGEINYPGPFDLPPGQRRRRSISESSSIYNIHLADWLQFQVTVEGLVSIGLVQVPGICLALYGIVQAIRTSTSVKQGVKNSLHASLLIFLPFFIVEIFGFFQFSFSSIFHACCGFVSGQCNKMVARKLDFLHFLGKKDGTGKAKMLCFDAAKVFCGSCVQLCFQIVLLEYWLSSATLENFISGVSTRILML